MDNAKVGLCNVLLLSRIALVVKLFGSRVLSSVSMKVSAVLQVGIVGDLRSSILEEVDFRKEAVSIEAFRNYVEATGVSWQATAPFVYKHFSTRRVLTMERFFGVPLTGLESIWSIVPNPEATLINALNVWYFPFIFSSAKYTIVGQSISIGLDLFKFRGQPKELVEICRPEGLS